MSYVTPNSTLQLFKGINLDNRYLHTIYFANESAQDAWFSTKVFRTYGNLMYRRYSENVVRIQADATELLGTTYMRFKNTRTTSKWFYAFVLGVEYVNENTADVYYEIDVMQSWFIQNGSIRPCMVLREHVNNDTVGANLEYEPEGSDVYDCDFITKYGTDYFGNYSVVINSTGEPDYEEMLPQGLFDGTKYASFPANDTDEADIIKGYIADLYGGSWDAGVQRQEIIDIFTVPTWLTQNLNRQEIPITFNKPTSYDNYTPKNKKLLTYPYSYLLCTTHNGSGGSFRWEYFDTNVIDFRMTGTYVGGGEIMCYPRTYNGQEDNLDCKISMNDFPKNACVYDAYQAWIAMGGRTRYENDKIITDIRGASAVLDTYNKVVNSATYNPNQSAMNVGISAGTGIVNTASEAMKTYANIQEAQNKIAYEFKDAHYRPNIAVGTSMPNITAGGRFLDFYFYHCHIRDDEVMRIDDFLSTYGYAINRVKQPNLTGRAYWNFVQTKDAVIAGDMPSSSKEAIGKIFDGGITFWHNGDQVGNYAQSVSDGSINNPII